MTVGMLVALVVGAICVGSSISAAFGDSKVISTALEGMARQPEVQGQLYTSMLIQEWVYWSLCRLSRLLSPLC